MDLFYRYDQKQGGEEDNDGKHEGKKDDINYYKFYNHGEMALARNVKLNKTTNLFKNKHKP